MIIKATSSPPELYDVCRCQKSTGKGFGGWLGYLSTICVLSSTPAPLYHYLGKKRKRIKSLPQENGVYILKNQKESRLLLLELAIESPNGVVNVIEISKTKIGFSGSPKVVQALLKFDFTTMGYQQKTFKQFGGGDVQQSMYFAFIPKIPPSNYKELIPPQFEEKIVNDIFNCIAQTEGGLQT
ncbi:hypothetical protein PN36_03595 [Candidatus Thiomargarita nelsonii]|uniref:Uncharacterized protein n=1 Tax=Candidatus Thiomargarita nelsonii TaxID=1003181 RepID=A0A0A6P940_9GAMM|nr:hypothetical protein PN36_03595 [Candidatus Thiomargarita nelsonii]